MIPTELNPLAALPYELIREICLNLDKTSLKSLRLAYPQPKLRAATAKLLFQTIELRLGTLEWSFAGAKSRLSHLDGLSFSSNESFDHPLALCKKLLIDTRYPWVVTPEGCIKANQVPHDRVPHDAWLEQRRMFDDLMVLIPEKQRTEFVDLVGGVLAATRNLRTVEWRTTSSLPIQIHQGISSLLCKPIDTRGFLLDVAISVSTFSDKCEYLDALSNVQYVAIKVVGSGPHRGDHHGLEEMREAGEVVKRCPDIKGFEFYSQAPVFAYATSDALRDALRDLDGLEVFKVDSNLGFTHEMDWTSLKDVKDLWISVEGSVTHNEDLEELYDGLKTVGTRLNKLSVESYIRPTHNYLLQHCSPLTELEIWGYWYGINQDLVHAFWDEIIPRHAPTLRKLKVQNHAQSENKSWSWLNKSDNKAKASLPKCKDLEELTIGFCEGTLTSTSWVTEMVEDLVPACPRLFDIHMTFELGDSNLLAQHVKSTLTSLDAWSSTSEIFNGRSLRLSHEDISKGVVCFPKQSKPDAIPPLWYESLLQSWELSRAISQAEDGTADQTVYRFERLDDLYLSNERLVQPAPRDEVDDEDDDDPAFAADDAEAEDDAGAEDGEAWYSDDPDLY
ncbi:hypothetical protein TWF970_003236 [Orbilia oligospora]|uniref:F-box domain-containing protein n=1 Tax=Orbilia oligospora TaxID=2813651 RepID=A0A7C8VG49_ORBOL|nr:hypothetical protein TWF970_003236 [Orbilia oligospora]